MSLQDDCNAYHQAINDAYASFVNGHKAAYAQAKANGANPGLLLTWKVWFKGMTTLAKLLCQHASAAANSVSGVTIQSSPGPKDDDDIE